MMLIIVIRLPPSVIISHAVRSTFKALLIKRIAIVRSFLKLPF